MRTRAQTTIDFAIGAGVFLIVVAFVFAFLPAIFEPFAGPAGSNTMVADRTADRVADDLLVSDPARPGVLDATCTREFFDTAGGVPADCRASDDADALAAVLGVDATRNVNVTIEDGSGVVSVSPGPVALAAGEAVSDREDAVVARRIVLLEDTEYRLYVRVW